MRAVAVLFGPIALLAGLGGVVVAEEDQEERRTLLERIQSGDPVWFIDLNLAWTDPDYETQLGVPTDDGCDRSGVVHSRLVMVDGTEPLNGKSYSVDLTPEERPCWYSVDLIVVDGGWTPNGA